MFVHQTVNGGLRSFSGEGQASVSGGGRKAGPYKRGDQGAHIELWEHTVRYQSQKPSLMRAFLGPVLIVLGSMLK